MKVEDLKFPMVVKWHNAYYTIVENGTELYWIHHHGGGRALGGLTRLNLAGYIARGYITVLAQPQPTTTLAKLVVDVDTTQVDRATEAARELASALKAVKDMLA